MQVFIASRSGDYFQNFVQMGFNDKQRTKSSFINHWHKGDPHKYIFAFEDGSICDEFITGGEWLREDSLYKKLCEWYMGVNV